MDRRSWLWRRRSSEKSPGETESSGSVSSFSERFSDDQDVLRASPNNASPNHSQSPEVSSKSSGPEVNATIKSLTEKLSAALLNISAKEDTVKQHMKVAEEAVAGWEKAETELAALKRLLEVTTQKNAALEDRISHLDGALKESVRQFRHSREEQEQRIHDTLTKKTREWEFDKFEFENQITELQAQLEAAKSEAAKSEAATLINHGLQSKLETTEKENFALKVELVARTEDLRRRTLEKELCIRAAESASKQHLESMKKLAKLQAECHRLRTEARKMSVPISNFVSVESLADSQSDCGERFLSVDNGPSYSDSCGSAFISEIDQFNSEKVSERNIAPSIKIDMMDDFLEMERLVTMPETDHGAEAEANNAFTGDSSLKIEIEAKNRKICELERIVAKMETEKSELEMILTDTRNRLEFSHNQLTVAEEKLVVLKRQLDSANEAKLVVTTEIVAAEKKGKALEYQLDIAKMDSRKLHEKVFTLQGQVEKDKTSSTELAAKLETIEARRKALECELETANSEVKKLHDKVYTLEIQVEAEKAMSSKHTAEVEALVAEREELECRLESAHFETNKLNEKVNVLEGKVEEEKSKYVESEALRKAIEFQFELAHLEMGKLHEKINLLEARLEEERSLSAKFAVKVEAAEEARMALETQLKLARSEVGVLRDKIDLLEAKAMEENVLSAKLPAKYQNSQGGHWIKTKEAELHLFTGSNGELSIEQDKELASAAGKLADCQKTIASLSRQLKSLASLDDFMFEVEKTI